MHKLIRLLADDFDSFIRRRQWAPPSFLQHFQNRGLNAHFIRSIITPMVTLHHMILKRSFAKNIGVGMIFLGKLQTKYQGN